MMLFPNIGVKRAIYGLKVMNFKCGDKLGKLGDDCRVGGVSI